MTKFKSEQIEPCRCGFKPDYYRVMYGNTPYDIACPNCKKQTTFAKCLVTGYWGNVIDYWNKHISKLTKVEMEKEVKEFRIEKKKNTGYDMYEYYDYYWEEGKGEVLYARC